MRAYSIYYVGINIGAFLAPLVCGTLGGEVGWHYGFAAAGIGMLVGTAIYLFGLRHLPPDELRRTRAAHTETTPFTADRAARDRRPALRVRAHDVLLGDLRPAGQHAAAVGRGPYRTRIDLGFWKGEIPTTWFLALNPLMIFVFTPILIKLWAWQARATQRCRRSPSCRSASCASRSPIW